MRRASIALVVSVLWALPALLFPDTARAECTYFVIPPATEAARTAREVIVGRVIENVGGQLYDFRLQIDDVLRGPASVGEVRRFEFVYPGWPLADPGNPMSGPCEAIPGWEGNVIALSLDALAPDGRTRYNAASWISGATKGAYRPDLPRTTLDEMIRLVGLPSTDTDLRQPTAKSERQIAILAVLAFAVAVVGVATAQGPLRRR